MSGAYLQDYTSYGYEISWMVITWVKTGVFCDNLPLLLTNLRETKHNLDELVSEKVENIVGKGESAGNQHFLCFPQGFQKGFLPKFVKTCDC